MRSSNFKGSRSAIVVGMIVMVVLRCLGVRRSVKNGVGSVERLVNNKFCCVVYVYLLSDVHTCEHQMMAYTSTMLCEWMSLQPSPYRLSARVTNMSSATGIGVDSALCICFMLNLLVPALDFTSASIGALLYYVTYRRRLLRSKC